MLRVLALVTLFTISNGLRNFTIFPKGFPIPKPLTPHDATKESRIVGGQVTTIEAHPYAASLQYEWDEYEYDTIHFCSATIISEDWILATGQCTYYIFDLENVTARVGSDHFHEGGTVVEIESVTIHPLFDPVAGDYDLALLKLTQSLTLSNTVQPVRLPKVNETYPEDTIFTLASWGALVFLGQMSPEIYEISLPTITNELCQTVYGDSITERMFCAYKEYAGLCIGDVGAGAVVDGVLIGVASFDYACSAYGYPGIYTSIPAMVEWITEITGVSSATSAAPVFSLVAAVVVLFGVKMNEI